MSMAMASMPAMRMTGLIELGRCWSAHPTSGGQQITENEAVARHPLARGDRNGCPKHRARAREGVELAVLGTRVDAGRQLGEQRGIEAAAGETLRQLARVQAGDIGRKPAVDHGARELAR